MSASLTLRSIRRADLPRIRRIQSQSYSDLPPERYRALRSRLRAGGAACAVAEHDGSVIGHVQALEWPLGHLLSFDQHVTALPMQGRDVIFVYEVAVAPRHQGLGAGRCLVEHVEALARARRLMGLALVAYGDAVAYWERRGFRAHPLRDEAAHAALASYGGKGRYFLKRLV